MKLRTCSCCLGAAALALALAVTGFNYVVTAQGVYWGIQDAAPPGVDTGSIRATQIGSGPAAPYSTSINGYGGIRLRLDSAPAPVHNGILLRGFGLTFDGTDHFTSAHAVVLGGVAVTRSIYINRTANWGRWFDVFTNTTARALPIEVAFGGQTGFGADGPNSSRIVKTSSGGTAPRPGNAWVEFGSPLPSGSPARGRVASAGGPQVTVLSSSSSQRTAFSFAGDWLGDPFHTPYAVEGHAANFPAFVYRLTLPAYQSRSLLHFVILGAPVTAASIAATRAVTRAAAEATAVRLAAAPDLAGLNPAQRCSIVNFDLPACGLEVARVVPQPPPLPAPRFSTASHYDVVNKTVDELQRDMEAGVTTSVEITQAYLDRIAAYDRGPFGFHAYEIVASDALGQARAADAARRAGQRGPLLGIPVAIKNLYDTFDMATTDGSLTFAGFRPAHDAFQVARLRAAGAVILGKAAMEEYATNGFYSNDAWGQVWNAFDPSRSALGSSGGSAVAVAASLAAVALGTQTGDSLYGPASAASLVTLRGTDGLASGSGIMPLVWMTDFGGVLARSVGDLADMLTVTAGTDPADPATRDADAHIPRDWRSVLDPNALRGKRIGYIASTWVDPFGTSDTIAAEKAALHYLTAAGATIVPMGVEAGGSDFPPRLRDDSPGDVVSEGWMQYLDAHPELAAQGFPLHNAVDVDCSQKKIAYVRLDPAACRVPPAARMSAAEIQAKRDFRHARQELVRQWMDAAGADHRGVDAIVYPGLLSEISANDGGGNRPSFGRRDTPSAAYGVPTIAFPAGADAHGQPVDIQLLGRAWDDAKLVGMAYAFERLATPAGHGHLAPATAPALPFRGR